MPNLTQYKNALANLARPNQFQVSLFFPGALGALVQNLTGANQVVQFMCKNATIPKSEIGTMPIKVFGRPLPMPGDRLFESMSLSVYNDEGFTLRSAFEAWLAAMQPHSVTGVLPNFSTASSQNSTSVYVSQLGRDGSVLQTYEYQNAFPTTLSEIALDWSTDNTPEEYTVSFAYSWWTTLDIAAIDAAGG